ncbi:ABC-2 family transporter protein [Amycolatopsis sp. NPDC004368]
MVTRSVTGAPVPASDRAAHRRRGPLRQRRRHHGGAGRGDQPVGVRRVPARGGPAHRPAVLPPGARSRGARRRRGQAPVVLRARAAGKHLAPRQDEPRAPRRRHRALAGGHRCERVARHVHRSRRHPLPSLPAAWQPVASLLPIHAMLGLPAAIASGTSSASGVALQAGWCVVFTVAAVVVWRSGVRRYTAVGA